LIKYKFILDSLLTLIGKVGYALAFFCFQALLAKSLSPEKFGQLGRWLVSVEYCTLLFGLGLNVSLIYYSHKKNIDENVANFINVIFYLCAVVLASAVLYFSSFLTLSNFTLLVAVFSTASIASVIAVFQSRESFLGMNLNLLGHAFVVFLFSLCVYVNLFGIGDCVVSLQKLYSSTLLVFFTLIFYFSSIHNGFFGKLCEQVKKIDREYFFYGIKSVFLNVMGKTLLLIDIFIVGFFLKDDAVAYYYVASSVVKASWLLVDSMGAVIFPRLVVGEKGSDELLCTLSQISMILSFVMFILFALCGIFFLRVLFSPSYVNAYSSVLILLASNQGMVLYKLLNRKFAALNQWRYIYISLFYAILINVILNIVLIPFLGIVGAAIASFVYYWFCGIFMLKYSGDDLSKFFNVLILLKKIKTG